MAASRRLFREQAIGRPRASAARLEQAKELLTSILPGVSEIRFTQPTAPDQSRRRISRPTTGGIDQVAGVWDTRHDWLTVDLQAVS